MSYSRGYIIFFINFKNKSLGHNKVVVTNQFARQPLAGAVRLELDAYNLVAVAEAKKLSKNLNFQV